MAHFRTEIKKGPIRLLTVSYRQFDNMPYSQVPLAHGHREGDGLLVSYARLTGVSGRMPGREFTRPSVKMNFFHPNG